MNKVKKVAGAPKNPRNNSVVGTNSMSIDGLSTMPDESVKPIRAERKVKIRGTGAATKGIYARGPMA